MQQSVIDGYVEDASLLIQSFEAISSPDLLSHILGFIPHSNDRVIEIGAGTGRDAAWLASKGLSVLAVEPVSEFRAAGQYLHPSPLIEWLNDSLPALAKTMQRKQSYQLALLISVWQHIPKDEKLVSLSNLYSILEEKGRLIISVRNGPGAKNRKCYPTSAEETIKLAQLSGFELIFRCNASSSQESNKKSNVTWTWLVFEVADLL
ncbi:MAG: methyltransferase domain-containing protein [Cognaticolwellia sp.]